MTSTDSTMARELFKMRLQKSEADFLSITGDDGDVLRDPEVACGNTALTFENVSFSVEEKVILQPISGHFEPGQLVAVMGPSGSGKTTLLDILAGKKSAPHGRGKAAVCNILTQKKSSPSGVGGTIRFNGRRSDHLFPRLSAYVAQDDILPAHLTVEEAVMFHQALKTERPSKFTHDMCQQRIHKALEDLGLLGVKDEYIGDRSVRGISGGQRRRVSLACGFAHMPQIMFCDEPTSGLSATDAETCVKYMRLIAHRYGITLLVVIHQPRVEVARMFDHLLLLTGGGRCVYNGPMKGVQSYCAALGHPVPSHMNPTDHIMDKVTPGSLKACEDQFLEAYATDVQPTINELVRFELDHERDSPMELLQCKYNRMRDFGSVPKLRQSKYGVRFRRQLELVGKRQVTLYLRDKRGIALDLMIAVGKGLILGLTYLDIGGKGPKGQLPFFFMLMMAVSIDGMKGMPKLISERRVMKMETSEALYSEWAYIIPFSMISTLQALMANTIFMALIFMLSSLQWPLFGMLWVWTTVLYMTMDSMFLMLSAVAKDTSTAFVMALPFFMLFLLFNGFTVTRDSAPWYLAWIVEISPVAHAIEQAMMAAVDYYDTFEYKAVAQFFSYEDKPGQALIVMFSVTAIFRILQVAGLKFLNNIQR